MMYLVLIQSLVTAVLGSRLRWQPMYRTGMAVPLIGTVEATDVRPGRDSATSADSLAVKLVR